jgi:hypothetical protein
MADRDCHVHSIKVVMPMHSNARNIFALLCLLGIIAVAVAAVLEIRRMRRGESLITAGQFRLRLLSAVIWMILLGSTSYAILALWPQPGDAVRAVRFFSVVSGIVLLLIIALLLMAYDLWQFSIQRRIREAEFNRELAAMAQAEIQRAQEKRDAAKKDSLASPSDSAPKNGLRQ